jgi:hypothetical protein
VGKDWRNVIILNLLFMGLINPFDPDAIPTTYIEGIGTVEIGSPAWLQYQADMCRHGVAVQEVHENSDEDRKVVAERQIATVILLAGAAFFEDETKK